MSKLVTRFAPSPTGYIHIGNIRAALYPWLLYKQKAGSKFILRIEDTDQSRFVEDATELIVSSLKWLGIDWNEGYEVGGTHGPYVQSDRKDIYKKYAQKLIDKGLAYADPYTQNELNNFREQAKQAKQPFLYRNFRPKNSPDWDCSQPLRLKVVEPKRVNWYDPIMGELSAGPEAQDDFILIKSDGLPTYNFAHVVDDQEMGVTLVMRGLEYISSIPKYLSLYEALEIEPPTLACMPHIMAPSGNKKLGKRDGAKSLTEYIKEGILPEAMMNFLALLGWNDGTEQEIFTKNELIAKFTLERVQRSGARFDEKRLLWMNGQWIKKITVDDLYTRCADFWPLAASSADKHYKMQVLKVAQDRLKTLADLPSVTSFFFEEPKEDRELITQNKQLAKFEPKQLAELLDQSTRKLENTEFNNLAIQHSLNALLGLTSQKPAILFGIIRIALTWAQYSPDLPNSMVILGKQETLARLKQSADYIRSNN